MGRQASPPLVLETTLGLAAAGGVDALAGGGETGGFCVEVAGGVAVVVELAGGTVVVVDV
jgi:hypothetical protein